MAKKYTKRADGRYATTIKANEIDPKTEKRKTIYIYGRTIRELEEKQAQKKERYEQLNLFTDYGKKELEEKETAEAKEREKHLQQALLEIKKRYGKNAVLKGMNLEEGATTIERNSQIGGHKA